MTDDEARCGTCGRLLTDPASKARGMGPVCAAKTAEATRTTTRTEGSTT
jgi:hypothetical protein